MDFSMYVAEVPELREVLVEGFYMVFFSDVVFEESLEFGFINPAIFLCINNFKKTIKNNIGGVIS